MPSLSDYKSARTTKLLLVGDHGTGKSGALASLAAAGYNLRILDLEAGLDILFNLLSSPNSPYDKSSLARVTFETITDSMRNVNGRLVPGKATAWTRAVKLLDNWKTDTESLGSILTWTQQDVLVIDSLSAMSRAALNFVLSLNARLGQQPHQSDWYQGQMLVESLLEMLYDDNVVCNVVVTSHITFIGDDSGPVHGYPNTLGKALPPKVGRYFNTILMARTTGSGQNLKRKIHTTTVGAVELKNTNPLKVKAEYPLETGLADYFRDVRGEPTPSPAPGTK